MFPLRFPERCALAALYHVCDHLGWTDLINTHMSARIQGEPNTFLINNYGEMFDEVTASSLIKMDMDGNVLGAEGKFNNAGFTIHSGVYKARPDAMCVTHTHTRAGAGISMIADGIRPISQDALHVYDDLAYHAYGVPATEEECDALARQLHFVVRAGQDELPDGSTSAFYVFAHGLYREVLYLRQAAARRSRRHIRIAERLGELFAGREANVAREMATHYEAAGDLERAASALQAAAERAQPHAGVC